MRNFILGFVAALSCSAVAADRADDWILTIDREAATGAISRRLAIQQHVDIAASDWPGMRGAAAQSLSALDSWMTTKGWGTWWMSMSAGQREAGRQAILLGQ